MSARESAIRSLVNGGYGQRQAQEILSLVCGEAQNEGFQRGRRTGRTDAFLEAVTAARGELLQDATDTPEDEAYNRGVSDAVAAIEQLLKDGAR